MSSVKSTRSSSSPLQDISNVAPNETQASGSSVKATAGGAWGSHLLNQDRKIKASSLVKSASLDLSVKMAGKLSRSHSLTRSSLRSKGRGKRKKADSFDTMMAGDDDMGQQHQVQEQEQEEKPVKRLCSDPMARFDPELSMDGVANEDDNNSREGREQDETSKSSFSFFDEVSCQGVSTASTSGGPTKKRREQKPVNFLTYKANSMGGSLKAPLLANRSVDQSWLDRCAGADNDDDDHDGGVMKMKSESKPAAPVSFANLIPKTSSSSETNGKSSLPSNDNCYDEPSQHNDSHTEVKSRHLGSAVKRKAPVSEKEVTEEIDSDVDFIVSEGEEESLLDLEKPKAKKKPRKSDEVNEEAPNSSDIYALGFEETEESCSGSTVNLGKGGKRAWAAMSREDRLRQKLKGDNYVKINLKKKTYVKGRKTMTGAKYRRMEFKRKMAEKEGKGGSKKRNCFRCGEEGHWANECTGTGDKLMPEVEDGGEGDFPTLEEAADMARGLSTEAKVPSERADVFEGKKTGEEDMFAGEEDEDAFLLRACAEWQPEELPADSFDLLNKVPPYFSPEDSDEDCLDKMKSALTRLFDFEDFRHGQAQAALRILRGESTLVLLSTGAGKSLIYQLPAYLYAERSECITIVVSPLVSLMEDQVVGLPSGLRAACLHSNLTETQRGKVVDQIKRRRLHFLLISPEALAGGGGGGGGFFASLIRDLPPIAFVCIDEAHCVSQWSHNFRPAYLRLCRVIRERLGVRTVLGLTATAPESTVRDVAEHLSVDPNGGVIRGELMPKNLVLSVSKDEDRERALIRLLEGPRFAECDSIIVYCTRRETCERLAVLIRTSMQSEDLKRKEDGAAGTKGSRRKGLSLTAEPYHAGMSAYKRKSVQNKFMSGQLRVVVATVAFGMGIDKSDIRAIVHYNMPKTFESYIQEIGRAGRDGKEAHCHLFLSNTKEKDLQELRRHIYANSVDEQTIRKLLDYVFAEDEEEPSLQRQAPKSTYREVATSLEEIVESLDLPEENISTLLCYLENDPRRRWVKLLNPVYSRCRVRCYNGPRQLKVVSRKSPPLAAALALERKAGKLKTENTAQVEFPVVGLAAKMGWDSGVVKRELKNLQWTRSFSGAWKKSGVLVEFSELAFHFEAVRALAEEERDYLKNYLHERVTKREKTELYDLQRVYRSFDAVSCRNYRECCEAADAARSDKLKSFVEGYFTEEVKLFDNVSKRFSGLSEAEEGSLKGEVRQFVLSNSDHKWHGRAVARIFHGIGSPCFPAKQWGRVHRYWRSHLDVDFEHLCRLARQAILELKGLR